MPIKEVGEEVIGKAGESNPGYVIEKNVDHDCPACGDNLRVEQRTKLTALLEEGKT